VDLEEDLEDLVHQEEDLVDQEELQEAPQEEDIEEKKTQSF
jgi:hypothetical protein